jgi:hypothetical protein
MTSQTESVTSVFEDAFENLRKTAETSVEMQQEMFRQWTSKFPGFPQSQNAWVERAQKFQKDWSKTVKELLTKHREVLDEEYRMAIDSLEEAFRVVQSTDPQDCAKRCESLCKKTLEVVREVGELQVKETQEALNKIIGLAVKAAN